MIDPDDLLDSHDVAELLGLANNRVVSVYRDRHRDDFPAPVVEKGSGRCVLWRRQDIEAWKLSHPGRRATT